MKKLIRILISIGIFLAIVFLGSRAHSDDEVETARIALQGDTMILTLEPTECVQPLLIFGRRYYCTPTDQVIIGVDMAQPLGPHDEPQLYPLTSDGHRVDQLQVQLRNFPTVPMKLPPGIPGKNRSNELRQIALAFERGQAKYPMNHLYPEFGNPLDQMVIKDEFGTKRGETQHRGIDLEAAPGTAVHAAGDGVVVLAGLYSLEGNMVIIYHGDDAYTLYMHLQDFPVHEGQYVEAGQIIGHSGSTGATTGPHLHFAAKIHGANVDPLRFISAINLLISSPLP